MKTIVVLVSCVGLTLTQLALADDLVGARSVPQRNVHAAAKSRPPTVHVGRNQLTARARSTPAVRQNSPNVAQPVRAVPLAMNKNQPRQVPTQMTNFPGLVVTPQNLQRANNRRCSYLDALQRCHRERHDCNWWNQHCTTIVFAGTGYYYLDASYWYPAFGYDPAYDSYDYDGPIYTYGNLLPDQVIANVQRALQDAGYFDGFVTGSLSPGTRAALANYQRDYGLIITGAIDEPTVISLGLI